MTDRMIATVDGAIGRMVFNNPARHNAVSLDMWQAIPRILDGFATDDAVRVIVLSGAGGKAFVSGADISEFGEKRANEEAVAHYNSAGAAARERLVNAAKPTIAMIRGYCLGGGLAVALSCDLRIAAEGSRFGIPAARLGLGYAPANMRELINVVGPARAKEIMFTARQFEAAEALRMGLVNQVVPADALDDHVKALADGIAANAPLTVAAAKRTINELMKDESRRDLAACDALVARCFASADYVEGRTAFLEKRKPAFTGR